MPISDIYRKLLLNGRTYASFNDQELDEIFNQNDICDLVLDPMSGYGGLMQYCRENGVNTYNIEVNIPSYLWQILTNPIYSNDFIKTIDLILSKLKFLPKAHSHFSVSDNWFSPDGIDLIDSLHIFIYKNQYSKTISEKRKTLFSLALLLPFLARFSNCVMGDVTHIKEGGFCVFKDWENDFKSYLTVLLTRLYNNKTNGTSHTNLLDDITNLKFKVSSKFSTFVTSPPYPNYRSYDKMFAPENDYLKQNKYFKINSRTMIGSNAISGRKVASVNSHQAKKFLKALDQFDAPHKTLSQIKGYYIPYFQLYFSDIEKAYASIATLLKKNCVGYIIVVNNTTRNFIVPVAEMTIELWKLMGFNAKILSSTEQFHFGTKNPNSKGLKAKHMKYTIKVWK